jgi:alpha-tubulin suppressor-like RCC1 family protein
LDIQPSPERVEALRGVRVSDVAFAFHHVIALTEDGLVCAWGDISGGFDSWANPDVRDGLLPKPVEALRGVRVGNMP